MPKIQTTLPFVHDHNFYDDTMLGEHTPYTSEREILDRESVCQLRQWRMERIEGYYLGTNETLLLTDCEPPIYKEEGGAVSIQCILRHD